MEQTAFDVRYGEYRAAVEDYLQGLFTDKPHWADLYDAMRYSLLAGGKRIRPVLTLEFSRLAGLDWHAALPVACALELVHTYSLIHDDLPCMDDDDLRRGKPTNHKVYGETLAVLAGDALQPEAFRLILTAPELPADRRAACDLRRGKPTNHKVYGETLAVLAGDALQPEAFRLILTAPELPADRRAACALILAEAAGADGMVAGQVIDTLHAPQSEAALQEVHHLKTGAMIAGACKLGAAAAGGCGALLAAAEQYGYQLGMAFQIRDDMLDVIGNAAEFGKPIGSDREEEKVTFVDLLGLEACGRRVLECTEDAKAAVAAYDASGFLCALADTLAERNK